MPNPVITALTRAVRSRGSEPLLTWYGGGARVEFSVRTFANWVDKTANLIESLDAAGTTIGGPLSAGHPGNWMSLVVPLAAWQCGCSYAPDDTGDGLLFVGPDGGRPRPGAVVVACSLHPLALGLPGLPDGVLDFSTEALAQPDASWARDVTPNAAAWSGPGGTLSHADVGRIAGSPDRRVVRTSDALGTLRAAILAPLLGGGSAVLVDEPAEAGRLERIATSERALPA